MYSPTHSVTASESRPNHLFVNAVRFWCMLAIVALHSVVSPDFLHTTGNVPYALDCFFKFGTIGFFLISGFLLGERVDTVPPRTYFSRRLKNVLAPWCFWFALFLVTHLSGDIVHHRLDVSSASSWFHALLDDTITGVFGTTYWFVPNLVLGICVLLLFRRYLYTLGFGLCLFAVNFVYVANIYARWFTTSHTTALFGFVSYLWLGSYVARNFAAFQRFMQRIPAKALIALCVLAYVASFEEVRLLIRLQASDAINTLRLSNQVFSVLVVLLIFKVKKPSWPSFVNVREQTFAIYLMHDFFLGVISSLTRRFLLPRLPISSYPSVSLRLCLSAIFFVFSYGGCLLVARWLARQNGLRWTIGLKSEKTQKVERVVGHPIAT